MKLRTVCSALLLSLFTAACATAPDDADDVSSRGRAIVSCGDASALDVDLETVYLEDVAAPAFHGLHKLPRTPLDLSDLDVPHKSPSTSIAGQADPGVDTAALCECADDGCVVQWIDDSLGCGVCAHVLCGDGERGGCVPCVSVDEPAASSCVFADATASAAE
jgi:hypothetical protein